MAPAPIVTIAGLTKRYGSTLAVRDLSLEVYGEEVFGFLGLNGAGKTTTIRVLLDLLRPTAGRASVLGHDCQKDGRAVRAAVGYLPGEMTFYPDMTGWQVLDLLEHLSARRTAPAYRAQLLERFRLPDSDLRRRIRDYSTGMKRKLGLVQAFQHDPPLLVLDEPTEGLDPLMQEAFYELLADLRARGRTVFMSSHVLSEVERVCGRIAVLRRGELAVVAPVEQLRALAPRRVRVAFASPVPAPSLGLLEGVRMTTPPTPDRWTIEVRGPLGPLVHLLAPLPVADLSIAEPMLEDVVIGYYGEAER
ncbi:MAG: ABC transporter ATP-binding protein [Bacteroidales bacterium]